MFITTYDWAFFNYQFIFKTKFSCLAYMNMRITCLKEYTRNYKIDSLISFARYDLIYFTLLIVICIVWC